MNRDGLSRLEKAALVTLAAGNAFNILLFAMGATLQDAGAGAWLVARLVFAVVQFVAFDLTIIATVQAMRDGRRGRWAGATVFVAALAAALIGLDVSTCRMPFLHAAYAVVLPLFMMHLAQPKRTRSARPAQYRRTIRALIREVRALRSPGLRVVSELSAHACRKCGASVDTQQQSAASARWGCAACRVKKVA